MQIIGGTVSSLHHHAADHQLINPVSDIGQCQRRIRPDILSFAGKCFLYFRKKGYALFHFTPSLVSSSTMPLANSSSRISSALAKFFAFLAA